MTALGRYDEAEPLLVRTYAQIQLVEGEHEDEAHAGCRRIIDLYEALDKPEIAAEYRAKLPSEDPD